ncbi:DUF3305 domain-containing protein [Chelativorans salis]|uniref:DUF3305 domain-containing protein n=1 Tax=Chelativorans salis TaxID=2978478 RepID=A0ABT2LRK8_9HYPH|nr:DUF3305 domain-containing protein [Chelativorans sp. EGI FJ00035]MCT7377180.1 DUF3305 domain-containing protein [Chelativorans sp. EGI FJ00035]
MIREATEVGVIVERRALKSQWADHAWVPVAALVGAPAAAPWTVLDEMPDATRYYAGAFQLEFFASETGMYRDNLRSGQPSLWVSLRASRTPPGITLHLVTADPAEAEALTEPGTDIIEAVPMPPEIQNRLAAFVKAHHVERPFIKRKRDRADTEAMARRVPGK